MDTQKKKDREDFGYSKEREEAITERIEQSILKYKKKYKKDREDFGYSKERECIITERIKQSTSINTVGVPFIEEKIIVSMENN